jgi:hypothetical protein
MEKTLQPILWIEIVNNVTWDVDSNNNDDSLSRTELQKHLVTDKTHDLKSVILTQYVRANVGKKLKPKLASEKKILKRLNHPICLKLKG